MDPTEAATAGSKPKATLIVLGWGGHSMAAPFNFNIDSSFDDGPGSVR
jgi:hypothetical protein